MHDELKKQYAKDVEKYENPWILWEFRREGSIRWLGVTGHGEPLWRLTTEYRRLNPNSVLGLIPKVKGHPHAELMAQYAEDAKTNPEPWKLWQMLSADGEKWLDMQGLISWQVRHQFRRKPKTTKRYIYTRLAYNSLGGTDLYTAQFDNCNPKNLEHQVLVGNSVKWAEPEWSIREVVLEIVE